METINRLLIILVMLAIIACAVISITITSFFIEGNKVAIHTVEAISNNIMEKVLEASKNKSILSTDNERNIITTHPYNECIKLFVDQAHESKIVCDYEKAKSVCFELLNKNKAK